MRIQQLTSRRLQIPLTHTVQHAAARRSCSYSFWVEARSDSHIGFGEGCPRTYVTGEDFDNAERFFRRISPMVHAQISDLASLRMWVDEQAALIDKHPAAWCAIELAILDLLGKEKGVAVERLLALPRLSGQHRYTAVIATRNPALFEQQLARYLALGLSDYKIKLSGDLALDRQHFKLLEQGLNGQGRIRVDGNNLFDDANQAIDYFKALAARVFAIEEPITAFDYDGMNRIAKGLGCAMIIDESFLRAEHFVRLKSHPKCWIANIRVSKMGGLLRSLSLVEQAKAYGIAIIVGAQVGETGLLMRAALPVAASAQTLLVGQEGAFGTRLLEYDAVEPSLRFARGGVLSIERYPRLKGPGFGLAKTEIMQTGDSEPVSLETEH